MKRWNTLSLRHTLFLGAALGILLPALVMTYFRVVGKFEADIDNRLRTPMSQYAEVLSRGLAAAIWSVDKTYAMALIDAVMRNPDVVSVTVTDEYQVPFAQKSKAVAPRGTLLADHRNIDYNGYRIGQITVVLSTARIESERLGEVVKIALLLLAQVLISVAIIWWLFERRMMRPLELLEDGAQRVAHGDLAQPIAWARPDEMGRLADGLDAMRSKLGTLLAERDQKNTDLQNQLTERKAIEDALSVSQAQFEAIFNASPIAMSVSSMVGEQRIEDVNGAWQALFFRDRDSIVGPGASAVTLWRSPEDRAVLHEAVQRNGRFRRHAAWMRRGDGQPDILCEMAGRVLSLGDATLLITSYDDITQKKKNEEDIVRLNATLEQRVADRTYELSTALAQLTAAQDELVRAEKLSALGALVAGIAHELNTPIGNSLTVASTLHGHAKQFSRELAQGLTRTRLESYVKDTREGAEILMSSLRHAGDLVTSFKQVAVDQVSAHRRPFDLAATMGEILTTLGPSLRKTTHTVACDIPTGIILDSYPGPLGQIVSNLVNNAVLHGFDGREGGRITIAARALDDEGVEITVSDDGLGIKVDNLPLVFDPFFTTRFGKGGSGLGLNIVYKLATTTLGGRIRVESEVGHGARFILQIPKRPE
jgi:signal transduction histidine kinase/HAMP domain-containing protein